MSKIIKVLCIMLSVLFMLPFVGCDKVSDAYIYFELPETPTTLDPQVASSDSELLIVRNIFEGLTRENENGEIVCAAAESFSKNGLIYTFKLRKELVWSNGEKITANDFEFALKRAVNPETEAPFASRLFSVENAQKIYEGQLSADLLGVKSVDENTLQITLEKEDSLFLETLSTSIAMPCDQEFFYESEGKYGIFSDNLLSNGSYKLSRWRKETFGIRLYRNDTYNGNFESKNAAVFITCNKDKDTFEQLEKNNIDIAFIDSTLESRAKSIGLKTESIQNICWVMTIGKDFSKEMRQAFIMLISSEIIEKTKAEGYEVAYSLFPSDIKGIESIENISFYDKDNAKKIFLQELEKLSDKKFPSDILLYYYDNNNIKPVVNGIVGHWQSNFSAFINIEPATDEELLLPQLTDNTYSFAFFPVRADSNRLDEYLKKFSINDLSKTPLEIQNEILADKTVVPVLFQNTVFAYSPAIKNLNAKLSNGYIDFAYLVKED